MAIQALTRAGAAAPTVPPVAASKSPASAWVPVALAAAFGTEFAALAWMPYDRGDWLLENLISIPVATGLVLFRRQLPFSARAWALVFLFLALHEVGSHYTYSRVPWMEWCHDLVGWSPAWERNHYDRALHLAFGVLLTRPFRELLAAPLAARPALLRWLPICVISTFSCVYELLEWAAASVVDPELGIAFVGAQGDIWDAQKDMALALGGSCAATVAALFTSWRRSVHLGLGSTASIRDVPPQCQ